MNDKQKKLLNSAIAALCTAQTVSGDEHKNFLEDAIEALQELREQNLPTAHNSRELDQ